LSRESLLGVYNRVTGLIEKLPGGLQKPILRELTPIRQLFLEQRPARLLLIGIAGTSPGEFLTSLGAADLQADGSDNGWQSFFAPGRGNIQILDARREIPDDLVAAALELHRPDVLIFFGGEESSAEDWKSFVGRAALVDAPVVGLARGSAFRLQARIAGELALAHRVPRVLAAGDRACDEAICAALPLPAQLEFARVTNARRAQAHIAGSLLKSFSALCGVIGVQPIPLADMPILTALQTLMVGMIVHTTGRPFSARLAAEFLGALGFNIGAGLVLREGARALVRVVPIWGNAVSGFVAGAGTYAIGKAAIAYFIDQTPITETRRIFRTLLPRFGKKRPALPGGPPAE
jgi:uncharacterized protein (DUF697 family)